MQLKIPNILAHRDRQDGMAVSLSEGQRHSMGESRTAYMN